MTPAQALLLAEKAARTGAAVLTGAGEPAAAVVAAQGRDIKLDVDARAQQAILAVLAAESPFPAIAEEGNAATSLPTDTPAWIVDPLDGTYNFHRGLPHCAVSVALCRNGEPLAGAIVDLASRAVYTGGPGLGACRDGTAILVSRVRERANACLATGLPLGADFGPAALTRMAAGLAAFKKVRMFGSAAMSLAYLAEGKIDAYTEDGILLWDVAAGLAIVAGAGGSSAWSRWDEPPPPSPCALPPRRAPKRCRTDRHFAE